jgi:hypothetical protein
MEKNNKKGMIILNQLKRNINTAIEESLYIKFKIICLRRKMRIYQGIKEAISLFIKKNDN